MPFRIRVLPLLAAWLLMLAGLSAACAAPLKLRYAGARDFAPFESLDANGKPQGFQIDLLRALERGGEFQFDIALADWSASEAAFRAGNADLIAMVRTRERAGWAHFAATHATPAIGLYHPRAAAAPASLQDLEGKRIAHVDRAPMRETLAEFFAGPGFRFVPVNEPRAALDAVREGRADAALLPRAYADPLLKGDAFAGIARARFNLDLQGYAFAVPPARAEVAAQLDAALARLEADGTLEALRTKWLSSHSDARARAALGERVRMQWIAGGVAGALALAALLWLARRLRAKSRAAARERARREEADAALAAAEQRLAQLFAHHPDGMALIDATGHTLIEANPALCALLGAPRASLVGEVIDTLPAFDSPLAVAALRALFNESGALDALPLQLRRADGALRDCLVHVETLDTGAHPTVFALVRDVTELTRNTAELRQGYDTLLGELRAQSEKLDATRADLARSRHETAQFASHVSHDLRTPLHAIRALSDLTRRDLAAGKVDGALANVERIDRAAQRMDVLIAGLARLARNEQTPLERQPLDMQGIVTELWQSIAEQSTVKAGFRCEALPVCAADPQLAPQVWQNLLGNAHKFSSRGAAPMVAVDSFTEGGRTWYRVADNGVGFDQSKAELIFQPYRREHSEREFPGTGIGLAIVQRIVKRHDGEIRVRSSVGVGSVFEFTLEAPAAT